MSPIVQMQRRMMELGRCRLGEKGAKGEPKKLDTFRWTSASRALLDAIAISDGGTVREWADAPDDGFFEIVTECAQVDIIIPPVFSMADGTPTAPYSQWFELWSAAGCQRRCDGQTEALTGKACMCADQVAADGEDARECKVTTRFSFMRPDIPGLGVWRLESHGWHSAMELPGTLEVMLLAAAQSKFIPAVLRIEHRTKKQPGQPTKKFIVPVIDLPGVTVNQLAAGDVPLAINAPTPAPAGRAALPAGPPPPNDAAFDRQPDAGFGEPPPIPKTGPRGPVLGEPAEAHGEPPGTGASDLTDRLRTRLLSVAEDVGGDVSAVQASIEKNRGSHADRPDLHEKWLRRQIGIMEERLAEKVGA